MKRILTTIITLSFLLMSVTESLDIIKNTKTTHEIESVNVDPGGGGH